MSEGGQHGRLRGLGLAAVPQPPATSSPRPPSPPGRAAQERDRAAAVSDAAAALRMKRGELAAKRGELDALLVAKRAPLLQLLNTTVLPEAVQVRRGPGHGARRRAGRGRGTFAQPHADAVRAAPARLPCCAPEAAVRAATRAPRPCPPPRSRAGRSRRWPSSGASWTRCARACSSWRAASAPSSEAGPQAALRPGAWQRTARGAGRACTGSGGQCASRA